MIGAEGGAGRIVRCPICMDLTEWPSGETVYRWSDADYAYLRVSLVGLDERKRLDARRLGYQQCDNPSGPDDAEPHYLPANYALYQEPLVIGLVGASQSGKSHLLTAIIRQVLRGGLAPYDLEVEPLDFRQHEQFRRSFLEPFGRGEEIGGTNRNVVNFAESLVVRRRPHVGRPVVFFDVAGEDLEHIDVRDRGGKFLVAADAILFVYAPEDPLVHGSWSASGQEQAYRLSLARIQATATDAARLPVAIAVAKADRLRYRPPADRWLRRGDETDLNAARIRAESRDVYSYLRQSGGSVVLDAFPVFDRCTLHFVSASGGDVRVAGSGTREFPLGVKPRRVLEPLVSILAMAGVIPGPEAQKVGTP